MDMSSFVALPRGVTRSIFDGEFGPLVGLVCEPDQPARGTALLMPGFTGSKEDFLSLIQLLAPMGWAVATVDLRGQYESPGPDDPQGYAMASFAADAIKVAEQLRSRFGHSVQLLGHSFGGLVARTAIQTALSSPNLATRELFASLTLLSSGPGALPADVRGIAKQLLDVLPHLSLSTIWDFKEAADRAANVAVPPAAIHELHHRRFVGSNPAALAGKALILIQSPDTIDDLTPLLRTARLPTLVAYGEDDNRWTPAEQDLMAHRLGVRRFRWPQTAHSPAAEHPDWCAAVLEGFWSDAIDHDANPVSSLHGRRDLNHGLFSDPVGYTDGMELRLPVDASPRAVGQARRTVSRQLQAWGITAQIDDLQLLVSELVTNALQHVGGPIGLLLVTTPRGLRVEVCDGNAIDLPTHAEANDFALGGRGVPLIAAVASQWGVVSSGNGKTIWAELHFETA